MPSCWRSAILNYTSLTCIACPGGVFWRDVHCSRPESRLPLRLCFSTHAGGYAPPHIVIWAPLNYFSTIFSLTLYLLAHIYCSANSKFYFQVLQIYFKSIVIFLSFWNIFWIYNFMLIFFFFYIYIFFLNSDLFLA